MAFITNITTLPIITGSYTDGTPSYIATRHGNVRAGGTVSDSTNWSASSVGEGNPVVTIVSGVGPVEGAITSSSRFNGGTQVVNAIQTTIAGASNTVLQGAQSDSANLAFTPLQRDIVRTYYYKTAIIAGNWNEFTATFSSISNTAVSGVWNITAGVENTSTLRASGTDAAENPTQDAPGKLTYRNGSPDPVNGSYGARYNW